MMRVLLLERMHCPSPTAGRVAAPSPGAARYSEGREKSCLAKCRNILAAG